MKWLEMFIIGAMGSDLYNVTHNPLEHMRLRLCAVFLSYKELKFKPLLRVCINFLVFTLLANIQ